MSTNTENEQATQNGDPVETPTETVEESSLDDFSAEFFGENKADPQENANSGDEPSKEQEGTQENEVEDTTEQVEETGDDANEQSDEGTTDDDGGDEGDTKPKNRFQKRVDELTAARREAERRADALEERLRKLENGPATTEENPQEQTPQSTTQNNTGLKEPQTSDKNEDGSDKYPLGEFDPRFIRDQAVYDVKSELAANQASQQEQEARAAQTEKSQAVLNEWNAKLEPALERYPDFREKGANLGETFDRLDENYQNFLSETLMTLEHGPDVVYHLSNNIEEAEAIVAKGPRGAAVALGRLEAMFASENSSQSQGSQPAKKVSKAPTPPPRNKGASAVKATVPDDTDDLDAFERKFFS